MANTLRRAEGCVCVWTCMFECLHVCSCMCVCLFDSSRELHLSSPRLEEGAQVGCIWQLLKIHQRHTLLMYTHLLACGPLCVCVCVCVCVSVCVNPTPLTG